MGSPKAIARFDGQPLSSKSMNIPTSFTIGSAGGEFVESVLQLDLRVAAFDCDGTLWSGDAGERFFDWEIRQGVVSAEVAEAMRARYVEYKAGKVSEEAMCGEMVTMHNGLTDDAMMDAATRFMTKNFPGRIFPELEELVRRLRDRGCEIWAVSSSNEWVIRAGMKRFGIPRERILAAQVEIENGIVTDRLVRVPSGPGKPRALREVAKKEIDAAFGNSRWDTEMLAMAQHPFAINPNPDLEVLARERGWSLYFPDGTGPANLS
jgi:HAD superfamily phosphoserine phosphatase-like hydrolase